MKNTYLALIMLTMLIGACNKNQVQKTLTTETTQENASNLTLRDVKLEKGMLKFENEYHLTNCRNELSKMTQVQITTWQKSIGFTSLMSVMNDAQLEIKNTLEKYPNSGEEMASYILYKKDIQIIADKYKKYMDIDENGNITKMNLYDPSVAWLSNTANVLTIKNSLIYYDFDKYISIKDGSLSKLNTALASMQSNESEGIFFSKVETKIVKTRGAYASTILAGQSKQIGSDDDETTTPQSGNNRRRTSFYSYLKTTTASGFPSGTLTHSLYYDGYNQRRTTLAGWQPTNVQTNVNGSYYSTTFGIATINYFQGGVNAPYVPFLYSLAHPGVYYYTNTLAVKTVTWGAGAGTNVNYNFSANFSIISYHNNGTLVS